LVRISDRTAAGGDVGNTRGRYLVPVAALFAAQFAVSVIPFGIGALAPFLREEYDLSRSHVGLASAVIFVAVAACSVPAGRLTDRAGVARAVALSCGLVSLGTVGLALLGAPAAVGASLLVVGVGYSLISPSTNKGVIAATPPRLRGRAMGVKQMGVTAGAAVAAATLPVAVARAGLSPTLIVAAVTIAVIGVAAAAMFHRSVGGDVRVGVDARTGRPDPARRRRILRLGGAVGGMVAAQHVVATYLTLFLVERRGMTPIDAAGVLTVLHVSGTIARLGWGWVSDHLGSRMSTVVVIGCVSVTSLLALAAFGASIPSLALITLVAVLGAATQGGNAVYQVAIAEEDIDRAGWASGVGMALGFTGAIVAPPSFGAVVDATGSYTAGLVLTAGVVAAAVLVARRLAATRPG
jgi:ACS family hexuronate transporter-like MFS transporter